MNVCRAPRTIAVRFALWASLLASGAASPQQIEKPVTRVDLGFDLGQAGGAVSLPIDLAAPDGVRVGATTNEVTFPSRLFKFDAARKDDSIEADVKAELKDDGSKTGKAVVQVTVTAVRGRTLPNGTIARLAFHVLKDAKGPEKVTLANIARASSATAPPSELESVTGKDGEIELLEAPPTVIACFMYMH